MCCCVAFSSTNEDGIGKPGCRNFSRVVFIATVYVPAGKERYFLTKLEKYIAEETAGGNPKNMPLVNSIEDVKLAVLDSFWTDSPDLMPGQHQQWCAEQARG